MKLLQGLFGSAETGKENNAIAGYSNNVVRDEIEAAVRLVIKSELEAIRPTIRKELEPIFASINKLVADHETSVRILADVADGVSENKVVEYLGKTPKVIKQAVTRFEKLGEGQLRSQIRKDIVVIQKTLGGTYKKAYDKAYDRFAEVSGFYVYDHDKIKMRYKDSKGRWQQTTTYINLIADKGMLPQFASVVNDMKNKL